MTRRLALVAAVVLVGAPFALAVATGNLLDAVVWLGVLLLLLLTLTAWIVSKVAVLRLAARAFRPEARP